MSDISTREHKHIQMTKATFHSETLAPIKMGYEHTGSTSAEIKTTLENMWGEKIE